MPKDTEDLKVVRILSNPTYQLDDKTTLGTCLDQINDFVNNRGGNYYEDGELIVEAEDGKFYGFAWEVTPIEFTKEAISDSVGENRFAELFPEDVD